MVSRHDIASILSTLPAISCGQAPWLNLSSGSQRKVKSDDGITLRPEFESEAFLWAKTRLETSAPYATFRKPSVVVTRRGTILLFVEGRARYNVSVLGPQSCQTGASEAGSRTGRVFRDQHGWLPANSSCCYGTQASITDGSCVDQGLVYKRSVTAGKTWSAAVEISPPNLTHFFSNPVPVHDSTTGDTFLAVSICGTLPIYNKCSVSISVSRNDGLTFSQFRVISEAINEFEIGENSGFQMRHGPRKRSRGLSSHLFTAQFLMKPLRRSRKAADPVHERGPWLPV